MTDFLPITGNMAAATPSLAYAVNTAAKTGVALTELARQVASVALNHLPEIGLTLAAVGIGLGLAYLAFQSFQAYRASRPEPAVGTSESRETEAPDDFELFDETFRLIQEKGCNLGSDEQPKFRFMYEKKGASASDTAVLVDFYMNEGGQLVKAPLGMGVPPAPQTHTYQFRLLLSQLNGTHATHQLTGN